jgi:hypothetical protein
MHKSAMQRLITGNIPYRYCQCEWRKVHCNKGFASDLPVAKTAEVLNSRPMRSSEGYCRSSVRFSGGYRPACGAAPLEASTCFGRRLVFIEYGS